MIDGAVLITGGASGIGAAAARSFAALGHAVVVADIDDYRAGLIASDIVENDGTAAALSLDVRDDASVRRGVATTVERFGQLAVVVPNAGVFHSEAPLETCVDASLDDLVDVNFKGVVRVLRASIPHIGDGGAIVVTSSTSGLVAHPGAAVYGATKLAIVGLVRSLAAELAPRRVRVNAVCPGGVDTPLLVSAYGSNAAVETEEYERRNPLGKIGQPSDVAAAMVYLACASHVTGVALRVDGGDGLGSAL
jgi:NAD(P)-dependent dehydrogenase (short-subunit alcohol dehydrogenase family)